MRVKDLPDRPAPKQYLYCATCGSQNSATKGDYFMADPNAVIRCCGRPMVLVQEHTTRTAVRRS